MCVCGCVCWGEGDGYTLQSSLISSSSLYLITKFILDTYLITSMLERTWKCRIYKRNTRHTNRNILVKTRFRQFFSAQDCVPGTYVWTKNQVSKFCKENSNAFWVPFNLHEYSAYQENPDGVPTRIVWSKLMLLKIIISNM